MAWFGGIPYALVVAGALFRLIPHPPNLTPIGAIALFGGAVFPLPEGLLIPIAAMVMSDMALGFYPGMEWVYGAFLLIALVGRALLRQRTLPRLVTAAFTASAVFYLVTNFGVWLGPLYPHTLAGLWDDYVAALPFLRNTLVGDLGYSLVLFGLYEAALRLKHTPTPTVSPRKSLSAPRIGPPM